MRKYLVLLSTIFAIPLLMGMGMNGGNVKHNIPVPDKNFTATIVDSQGVTTKVTQITFDGKTYLTGHKGNTTVTVPFDKISSVQVGKLAEDKKASAFITLKAGGTLNITVEGNLPCYGSADFGNVQVEFKDIRKVDIHGIVPKETQ
ncbi:MAG: hypothetical protein AABY54_09995 [Deltaproteobacteria bacterium]